MHVDQGMTLMFMSIPEQELIFAGKRQALLSPLKENLESHA
jgi:hypothetical protein